MSGGPRVFEGQGRATEGEYAVLGSGEEVKGGMEDERVGEDVGGW